MVRFIKVVNTLDKVTDCVPVVSTGKNIGIVLYQLIHKVNKENPVKTSWKDDVKIHGLSKDRFTAGVASIPIIGNLTCLVYYAVNAVIKFQGGFLLGGPMGYLGEASRQWNYGTKKHSYEITALYLARNPDRAVKKMEKSLRFAAHGTNKEVFELLLVSRKSWSREILVQILGSASESDVALVLSKYKDQLTIVDAEKALSYRCNSTYSYNFSVVKLLVENFPEMARKEVANAIVASAIMDLIEDKEKFENITYLFEKFPNLHKQDKTSILLEAFMKGDRTLIDYMEKGNKGIIEENLNEILEIVAGNHNFEAVKWLFDEYKEKITSKQIGMVLQKQSGGFYIDRNDSQRKIIDVILKFHKEKISGEDLIPAMESAARNENLFAEYLKAFTQLEAEHLQKVLDNAVYGFLKNEKIAQIILKKFPEMKAKDPYQ